MKKPIIRSFQLLAAIFLLAINNASAQFAATFNGNDGGSGSAQYVNMGTVQSFTNFTIEMNIRYNGGNQVFDRFISTTNNGLELTCSSGGQLNVYSGDLGVGWTSGFAYSLATNVWQHLAFVRSGTTFSLFVNGSYYSSLSVGAGNILAGQWLIGANVNNYAENAAVTIDNFRLWNTSISPAQIATNYTNCLTGSQPNLIRLFNFEENTGTTLNDLATLDGVQNGTLTNSPSWTSGFACASTGASLNFDGSLDQVTTATNTALQFTTGTLECWFNSAGSNDNEAVLAMRTNVSNTRWSIHVNENGNTIGLWNGSSFQTISTNINPNTWYHLAVVITNSTTTFYVNGTSAGSLAIGMNTSVTGVPLSIGSPNDSGFLTEYFTGSMDEVRIWNRALCQSEIQNNMNGEIATTGTGLIASYHFNQGLAAGVNTTVTTLTDASGNSNNGTLTNFALTGAISNWAASGGVVSGSVAPIFSGPSTSIYAVNPNLCTGATTPLYASGAGSGATYTWNPGAIANASIVVSPTSTSIYSVSATNSLGCSSMQTVNIVVSACVNTLIPQSYLTTSASIDRLYGGVSGDIDGDSDKDIIVIDEVGTCRKYINNGSALFSYGGSVFTNSFTSLALADMDGDGDLDLVSGGNGTNGNRLFANNGSGTFTLATTGFKTSNCYVDNMTIADFDGDGRNDVAWCTGSYGGSAYSELWKNLGSNTFTFVQNFNNTMPRTVINSADIDGDGDKDLILSASSWNAEIYRNTAGTFTMTQALGGYCGDAKFVDFDNDGDNDIVVTDTYNTWGTRVSYNDGTGAFAPQIYLFGGGLNQSSRLADFDGDGLKDFVLNGNPNAMFAKGTGCGYTYTTTLSRQANNGVLIDDFNGDGKKDVFLMARDNESSIFLNNFTALPTATLPAVTSVTPANRCGTGTLTLFAAANTGTLNWFNVSTGGSALGTGNSYTTSSVSSNTTFYVSAINSNSCASTRSAVTVSINATPTIAVNNGTICSGSNFTIIPSGASTYTYSGGSAVVAPSTNTSYNVTGTGTNGCVSSIAAVSNVSVNTTPTLSVNSGSICSGNSFVLNPSGASTYTYSGGSATVSPSSSSSYSVTGTAANGCLSSNTAVSNVTVNITPTVSAASGSICSGSSFVIVASGANTYTYSSGSATVTPTVNASYNITGTSAQGCLSSNTAVSNVTVNTTPTVSVNSGSICSGTSFTITPAGASTYTYSSGGAIVTPTINASYTITGTSPQGCVSSNTAISNVTVNITPTVSANSGSICSGSSFTINPSGASTYTYLNGAAIVTPSASSSYSIRGTSVQGCVSSNTAVSNVTVNTTPTISVNSGSICSGNSFTMNPSGASTYTFSNGSSIATPTANSSYSLTGTSAQGCVSSNTAISNVTVYITPSVSVNSGSICSGNSFTMNPSGASSYTYSNGSSIVTPIANTSYTITGTSAQGCVSSITAVSNVTVNITPTVSVNSGSICSGNSFTLNPSGANTYIYSNGSAIVTPSSTASYSVSGTSFQGCVSSNTAVSTITVNITPTVSAGISNSVVCYGASVTLNGSGADTYTWSGGASNNSPFAPIANGSYTVSGTNTLTGCTSTNFAIVNVTVNSLPTLTASVTDAVICSGATTAVNAIGADTYTWTNGLSNGSAFNPTTTTTYSVTGTNTLTGCTSSNVALTVSVNPLPTLVITSNNPVLCLGETTSLTVSGASTYTWNTNSNSTTIVISPSVNTSYTVNGTDANNCSNISAFTQSISACTGISELHNSSEISIYPNPNNGIFFIELQTSTQIEIFNQIGQKVMNNQFAEGTHSIDISEMAKGVYFVKIGNKASLFTTVKLIVD